MIQDRNTHGKTTTHTREKDERMDTPTQQQQEGQESLTLRDTAFSFRMTPSVMVENLLNVERLTALMTDDDDIEMDEDLDDSDSDSGNDFIL